MRSTPSLMALLGLVAVAGYQNRSKISEMIGDARQGASSNPNGQQYSQQPDIMSSIGDLFQPGRNGGGTLLSGLGDLVNRFTSVGHGPTAQSWVSSGPNAPLQETDVATAIGDDTLNDLVAQTGLSRSELLRRLAASVPAVVNQLTPDGRLPTEDEVNKLL